MNTVEVIRSQYQASLEMLAQAIEKCPHSLWADQGDKNKFWHVAYHAIFYTHLYLQPAESDFVPWEKHEKDLQFMGPLPYPPMISLRSVNPSANLSCFNISSSAGRRSTKKSRH